MYSIVFLLFFFGVSLKLTGSLVSLALFTN